MENRLQSNRDAGRDRWDPGVNCTLAQIVPGPGFLCVMLDAGKRAFRLSAHADSLDGLVSIFIRNSSPALKS